VAHLNTEHFCQFIVEPPSQCGSYQISGDFNDPHFVCCGVVAHFQFPDDPEWLCAHHYDLILACMKERDPVAYEFNNETK
jgi:hypothetical protein